MKQLRRIDANRWNHLLGAEKRTRHSTLAVDDSWLSIIHVNGRVVAIQLPSNSPDAALFEISG